jgi:hypothetical protein
MNSSVSLTPSISMGVDIFTPLTLRVRIVFHPETPPRGIKSRTLKTESSEPWPKIFFEKLLEKMKNC